MLGGARKTAPHLGGEVHEEQDRRHGLAAEPPDPQPGFLGHNEVQGAASECRPLHESTAGISSDDPAYRSLAHLVVASERGATRADARSPAVLQTSVALGRATEARHL
jgi:hypothetical protein